MTLREIMQRHAQGPLVNPSHFGELVTYEFKDGSPERSFNAVVERLGIEAAQPGSVRFIGTRVAVVEFPRHATLGVESIADGDRIRVPMQVGEVPVSARIRKILTQDEAAWKVEVVA